MNSLLPIYKPLGVTPLQVIEKVRTVYPEYKNEKIGYAGRLDPLARGVLLLMIGDATKDRAQYLDLPKAYTFTVLFGVQTDTYDVLGRLENTQYKPPASNVNLIVNSFVNSHIGKHIQSYPPYSSKTVNGKPLFWWAKENKLSVITIPTREITINQFALLSTNTITKHDLQNLIDTNIHSVQGDFRQEEIEKRWKIFFKEADQQSFQTTTFTINCSSGTYVRGVAHLLGQTIGCGAIALDILRTHIGEYTLQDAKQLFQAYSL